jgi:hypothetical protein
MYKSSKQAYIFKYLFPVAFVITSVQMIYMYSTDAAITLPFGKFIFFCLIPPAYYFTQMLLKLTVVEANETSILISTLFKTKEINYSEIEWVSKFDLAMPFMSTIKYFDIESGQTRKVCFMPSMQDKQLFALWTDDITDFIKAQIEKYNVNYSKENEPSKIIPILTLSIIVALYVIFSILTISI